MLRGDIRTGQGALVRVNEDGSGLAPEVVGEPAITLPVTQAADAPVS